MDNYTHSNDQVAALLNHRSTPAGLLEEPAPNPTELETLLQCGLSAPDHAGLKPWRFITITGDARERLGDVFVEARTLDDPAFSNDKAIALKKKPFRAPLIIAVVADVTEDHPKTPRVEQVISAGVAAQHIQLAARAMGFGSVWLTGDLARHSHVKKAFGLKEADELVGYIYLGTPSKAAPARSRATLADHHSSWTG